MFGLKELFLLIRLIKLKEKKAEIEVEIIKFERTNKIDNLDKIKEAKDKLSSQLKESINKISAKITKYKFDVFSMMSDLILSGSN